MARIIAIPLLAHTSEDEALELAREIQQVFQLHYEPIVQTVDKVTYDVAVFCSTHGIHNG